MPIRYLSGLSVDSTVLVVDAANDRVGIGTASPNGVLTVIGNTFDIRNTGSAYGYSYALEFSTNATIPRIDLVDNNVYTGNFKTSGGLVTLQNSSNNALVLGTNNAERMRITSAGNVGIGTTAPATLLSLGAYSGSRLPYINGTANTFNSQGITVTSSNTANAAIGGGIDLTNNVHSVGSFSPLISFSALSQSGLYNNNYAAIYGILAGAGGDANWNQGHIVFATTDSYGASEKVRITSAGNVGIGTTAPNAKLHVFAGASNNTLPTNAQAIFEFNANGGIAVSTPPANAAGLYFPHETSAYYAGIDRFETNLRFFSGNSEKMRITAAGNVGIGTTAPTTLLDIQTASISYGQVRISSTGAMGGEASINFGRTSQTLEQRWTVGQGVGAINDSFGMYSLGSTKFILTTAGAATFSSSVTATQFITGGTPSNTAGFTNSIYVEGSLPSLTLSNTGTNTGKYTLGVTNGNFGIWNNATSSYNLFISAGNVGIGTTAPAQKLEVSGSAAGDFAALSLSNTNQSGTADGLTVNFKLGRTVDSFLFTIPAIKFVKEQQWTSTPATVDGALLFSTILDESVNERMRITSAGNVGIGTTNPGEKLVVSNGGAAGFEWVPITGRWYRYNRSTSAYAGIYTEASEHTWSIGASEAMRINASGNVGIGTTAPNAKLQIELSGTLSLAAATIVKTTDFAVSSRAGFPGLANNSDGIYFGMGANGTGIPAGFGFFREASGWNTALAFYTNNITAGPDSTAAMQEKMRITSAGNVGIGTTNPGGRLHIATPDPATNFVVIDFRNPDFGIFAKSNSIASRGNTLEFTATDYNSGAGNSTRDVLTLRPEGNVGIGTTSPNQKLSVEGGSIQLNANNAAANYYLFLNKKTGQDGGILFNRDNGNDWQLTNASGNGDLIFYSYGTASEAINFKKATGRVGIGTTAPNSLLHVGPSTNFDIASRIASVIAPGDSQTILTVSRGGTDYPQMLDLGVTQDGLYATISARQFTAGETKLILQPNGGNVGIGTTAPGIGDGTYVAPLTINSSATLGTFLAIKNTQAQYGMGGIWMQANTTEAGWLFGTVNDGKAVIHFGSGASETAALTDAKDGTKGITIDTAGNVGIGITAPTAKLEIFGFSTGAGLKLNYGNSSGTIEAVNFIANGGANGVIGMQMVSAGVGDLWLGGSGGRTLTLYRDGNVGIGTTAPSEKLHVDGSTLVTYNNSFQSTNSVGNKAILARVSPTSGIVNYAEYATAANLNGFVIGSDDARVKGNITGDSLEFITNTSTRMTILSSGNVGINTTTPGSTLHVIGDVLIQTGALGVGVNPNATDGRIDASNDIVAFSTSDRRLKENITPIANALEKVRSLTGVEFDWKEETKSVHGYEGHDVGVIAQDVQAVLPEAVRTNDSGYLSVRYEKMIALLVEANKELADRVEQLEKLIK